MNNLIIIGASGFGREVAWLTERINQYTPTWNIVGFVDDNPATHGQTINGYPVLGGHEILTQFPDAYLVCAIGSSNVRRILIEKIESIIDSPKYATLIDPSAIVSPLVKIGNGSIICAHTIITVNITIGKHVIFNLDCTVGHDSIIEDYVTVYPSVNISGNSYIQTGVELGTGSQIIQGKAIGKNAIIGAGAVVVKNIPENCTAVGCPATPIKFFN